MKKKVLLVIPAYNEEKNILKTCNEIINYNKSKNCNYDYIVINDGSLDKTEEVLRNNNINHIELIHNLGIGGAVQTGFKYAYINNYDIVVQFDGDGQHDITYVQSLIDPIIKNKANMVIGSRYINNISKFKSTKLRRIGIKIISFFIKICTKKKVYDCTSGFRAFDKELIVYFSNNYPLEYPEPVSTVEVIKNKKIIKEIGVNMNERNGGISSIRAWKNLYYMINVVFSIIVTSLRRYK